MRHGSNLFPDSMGLRRHALHVRAIRVFEPLPRLYGIKTASCIETRETHQFEPLPRLYGIKTQVAYVKHIGT